MLAFKLVLWNDCFHFVRVLIAVNDERVDTREEDSVT